MEHRRESDKLSNKLTQWGTVITAVGIIGSAILFTASLFFQTNKEAQAQEIKARECLIKVENKQVEIDNTIVEMKTDLKWIKKGVEEINQKIK